MKLDDGRIKKFEKYVQDFMKEHQAPGISVAIAQGDNVIYSNGFGVSDQQSQAPVTPDTVMGIASITKSFTAIALAQLRDLGKISFDDPVAKHLPSFNIPKAEQEVTIRHMLTHSTGLPPLPGLNWSIRGNTVADDKTTEQNNTQPMNTMDDLLNYISQGDYELLGPPGQYMSYSNDCYGILGAVIEAASGLNYSQYIREKIFKPLGMDRSTFDLDELLGWDDVTTLYYSKDGETEIRSSNNWQQAPPYEATGFLKASARDLIKFFQMYAGQGRYRGTTIVSSDGVKANMADPIDVWLYRSYGHALRIQSYHGLTIAEHGGSLKGVASHAGFIPEKGVSAVVLCNRSGVPISNVWMAAINIMLGLAPDSPRFNYTDSDWEKVVLDTGPGKYGSMEGANMEILRDGTQLVLRPEHEEDVTIRCVGPANGAYHIRGDDSELRFYHRNGQVWALGLGSRIVPKLKN